MVGVTLPGHVTVKHHISLTQLQRAHQVLNTTELLERIIRHLPPDSLLRAPQISKSFAQTIATSPTLRAAVNVALRIHQRRVKHVSLPPLINGIQMCQTQAHGETGVQFNIDFRENAADYFTIKESRPLQRMPLAYPAPTKIMVYVDCACERPKQRTAKRGAGLRFGDLFDAIDHLLRGRASCRTCHAFYYVRSNGRLSVARASYSRMLMAFRQ